MVATRDMHCRHCGSDQLALRPGSGPHALGVWCDACGRHQHWLGAALDAGSAAAFVMPFGKHKGRTLAQIAETDRPYLAWLAAECQFGRIADRAAAVLEGSSS